MRILHRYLRKWKVVSVFALILVCATYWYQFGFQHLSLHVDLARDLHALSELWIGNVVWLGPQLRVGFPISPLYFYLLFPGVIISGGSIYSLIVTHVVLAGAALTSVVIWMDQSKKYTQLWQIALVILSFAAAEWWIEASALPWNGHLYLPFVLAGVAALWFRRSLYISLLLFGMAVAIHPAALLIAPIFVYEVFVQKTPLVHKIAAAVAAVVLPWLPIIGYELITKGFLLRQFMAHNTSEVSFAFGLTNITGVLQLSAIPEALFLILVIAGFLLAEKRAKIWFLCLLPATVLLVSVSSLHQYYLLGLLAAIWFVSVTQLVRHRSGTIVVAAVLVLQLIHLPQITFAEPSQLPQNRASRIREVLDKLQSDALLPSNVQYAVVSVINPENNSPQADEYRFFLRVRGYDVASIPLYNQADRLLVFFEYPEDNPQNWRDWHTEQFGAAQVTSVKTYGDTTVVVYTKQ